MWQQCAPRIRAYFVEGEPGEMNVIWDAVPHENRGIVKSYRVRLNEYFVKVDWCIPLVGLACRILSFTVVHTFIRISDNYPLCLLVCRQD